MTLSPHLALMEGLSLNLPLLLQTIHNILVAPANLVRKTLHADIVGSHSTDLYPTTYLDSAVLPSWLQSENPEGLRHDHALLPVVWGRNALEELQAFNGSSTACCLVRNHSADSFEEDLRGCAEVERARFLWVDNMALVEEVVVAELMNTVSEFEKGIKYSRC